MITPTHTLAAGDSLPMLSATLTDIAGVAVPLTQAETVVCRLRPYGYSSPIVNGAGAVDDATLAKVHYDPLPDVEVLSSYPGIWAMRWIVTFQSGQQMRFPDGDPEYLQVSGE